MGLDLAQDKQRFIVLEYSNVVAIKRYESNETTNLNLILLIRTNTNHFIHILYLYL